MYQVRFTTHDLAFVGMVLALGAPGCALPPDNNVAASATSAATQASCDAGPCDTSCDAGPCDSRDPSTAGGDIVIAPAFQWSRNIHLHISYPDLMGWASIETGSPGDEVWIDRTFTAGADWQGKLGDTFVPGGQSGWRTQMFSFVDGSRVGRLRACGKAGDRPEIACTPWLPICYGYLCDGGDPAVVSTERVNPPQTWVLSRKVALHMWDAGHMGWASIDGSPGGNPPDDVWLDRSWDGGHTWEAQIGDVFIPAGQQGWRTRMYVFDDVVGGRTGMLRACGRTLARAPVSCTAWTRLSDAAPNIHDAAVDSLLAKATWTQDHNWWWSANAVTTLLGTMSTTGGCNHWDEIQRAFNRGGFRNNFNDDTEWWALAWMDAYHIGRDQCAVGDPKNSQYLQMAIELFDQVDRTWDSTICSGGIPWQVGDNTYKNTISNELHLKLAAGLYVYTRDARFLSSAVRQWTWMQPRLRRDNRSAIMDDFGACGPGAVIKNISNATFTYNQGVILGGLVNLALATGDTTYLQTAETYANDGIRAFTRGCVVPNICIFHEDCELTNSCSRNQHPTQGDDADLFKGIFLRNLRELLVLNTYFGRATYNWRSFLTDQRSSIIARDRSAWADFGFNWAGPISMPGNDIGFGTQISAVDLMNASEGL
jgi:predicted alpha-1,6-mannanase (GH76 family)